MGNNAVAHNTGLSSFVQLLLLPKSVKSREIHRKIELIAVQGHSRSLVDNNDFGRNSFHFRNIDAESFFPPLPCLMTPMEDRLAIST